MQFDKKEKYIFQVLYYLQSEKIWAVFPHSYYMFMKNYQWHWIADRANIHNKYIISMFFNFECGFMLLGCVVSKCSSWLQETFAALYFYIYELKKCLRFWKSYFKLEILIFLSFVMSFLVDEFNKKAPFLTMKILALKSETYFSREAIKN